MLKYTSPSSPSAPSADVPAPASPPSAIAAPSPVEPAPVRVNLVLRPKLGQRVRARAAALGLSTPGLVRLLLVKELGDDQS